MSVMLLDAIKWKLWNELQSDLVVVLEISTHNYKWLGFVRNTHVTSDTILVLSKSKNYKKTILEKNSRRKLTRSSLFPFKSTSTDVVAGRNFATGWKHT